MGRALLGRGNQELFAEGLRAETGLRPHTYKKKAVMVRARGAVPGLLASPPSTLSHSLHPRPGPRPRQPPGKEGCTPDPSLP